MQNEGVVIIGGKKDDSITLNSVFHVPSLKKNLLSVANIVHFGNYVLFGPKDVKFLRNIKELKVDVLHKDKRVDELFILSASSLYVNKMSTNENTSLWSARLGILI